MKFALWSLGPAWSFLLNYFSLLEWKYLSYACPTTVFWEHLFGFTIGEEFCLRMNPIYTFT